MQCFWTAAILVAHLRLLWTKVEEAEHHRIFNDAYTIETLLPHLKCNFERPFRILLATLHPRSTVGVMHRSWMRQMFRRMVDSAEAICKASVGAFAGTCCALWK